LYYKQQETKTVVFLYKSVIVRYMTLVTKLHIYTIKDSKDLLLDVTSFMFLFIFFHHSNISLIKHEALFYHFFVLLDHYLLSSNSYFSTVTTSAA